MRDLSLGTTFDNFHIFPFVVEGTSRWFPRKLSWTAIKSTFYLKGWILTQESSSRLWIPKNSIAFLNYKRFHFCKNGGNPSWSFESFHSQGTKFSSKRSLILTQQTSKQCSFLDSDRVYAGINLTGYNPSPGLTPGPLIFSVKIPTPGTVFQCKTPAPGSKKGNKIPTPGHNLPSSKFYISSFFPNFP